MGDANSKVQKSTVEEAVCGDNEVTKLECVGHVQKRLDSRLQSLKRLGKACPNDDKSIRGAGRLKNNTIDKIQVCYGEQVETIHTTFKTWKMLSWPFGITISQSTDDSPENDLCQNGNHSWCGYQRDQAMETSDYQHSHPFPRAFDDAIYQS